MTEFSGWCDAGTGKTLVARALAATASRAGRKVAFFMRKGADVLSKWVGEAERQLRMLFEEAQRQQPSIIFFDEIDGLAPVRWGVSSRRTVLELRSKYFFAKPKRRVAPLLQSVCLQRSLKQRMLHMAASPFLAINASLQASLLC